MSDSAEWTAQNPPSLRELGETYLLTLFMWSPPILFATGLHEEAIRFLAVEPAKILAEGMETTIAAGGESATESTKPSSPEPVSVDELSPGAFLLVALLQLVMALFVMGFAVMATIAGIVAALVWVVGVIQMPRRSYRGTLAYYRAHRGDIA